MNVLYVDDEQGLLEVGRIFLEQSGRFTVVTALSAEDGLALLKEKSIDCIVSDYQMPEMDGISFLKRIRSERNPVPFILFTGRGREEVVIEALNEGADFYIQKGGDPRVQFTELAHKVMRAVDRRRAEEALNRTRALLDAAFEQSPVPLVMATVPDMTLRYVNNAAADFLGINAADYRMKSLREVPITWKELKNDGSEWTREEQLTGLPLPRALGGLETKNLELPVKLADGRTRWEIACGAPVRDENGNLIAGFLIMQDITDRKRAEAGLRKSELFTRALLDAVPTPVFYKDRDGRYLGCNRAFTEITGTKPEDLVGKTVFDLWPPDLARKYHQMDMELIRHPEHQSYEYRIRDFEGKSRPVIYAKDVFFDESGRVAGIVGAFLDISDRVRAEEELRAGNEQLAASEEELRSQYEELALSERRIRTSQEELQKTSTMLESLLDAIPDVIGVQDAAHGMIRYNAAGYAMLGQTPEGIGGKRCYEMIGHGIPCDICATSETYRTKKPAKVEKFVPELGAWLDVRSYPVLDDNGEIRFVIEHLRDITVQKLAEEEIQKKSAELSAANEQLAEVADSIPGVVYQFYARDDGTKGVHYYSRRAADLFGYAGSADDFFPWFADHVDERDRPAFLRSIDTAVSTASPWHFEGRFVTPAGTTIWFQGISRPVRRGNELIFNGVLLDITGRKMAEDALRESGERLQDFINSTLDSVSIIDQEGIVVEWNPSCERMSGIAREDALGRYIWDLFSRLLPQERRTPEHRSLLERKIRTALQNGLPATPEPVVTAIERSDGTRMIIRQVIFPMKTSNGFRFGLIAQDITREKQAEDARKESEERFRALVETSPDMIWEIDQSGTFRYISPRVREILGYEPSELVGRPVVVLVPEHARTFVMGEIAHHAGAKSGIFTLEVPAKHKDGRDLVIEIRSAPVHDAAGTITGLRGTAHDITRRRKALADLTESGELFRKLVATVPDIVVRTDLEGRIIYANEKALGLGGYTDLREITGTPVFRYFAPEDLPRALENTRLMFEQQLGPIEYTFISRDGTRHVLEINGDVLRNPDGAPYGMVYVGRDVTQRKKADEAVRRAQRQLDLLSSVTRHDILNKVSLQLGLLELARQKVRDSPEMAAFIQKLESAAQAIREQIEFTRVYQEMGSREPRWQDLHQTLAEIPVPAGFSVSDDCGGTMIYADVMLGTVFANLIDNAVRHGGTVTRISMTAEEVHDTLVIRFADNGVGIPVEEKEKIFGRGYGKNTGFGLFLVREILSLTGITIRETGEPGKGARFEITVPKGAYRFSP